QKKAAPALSTHDKTELAFSGGVATASPTSTASMDEDDMMLASDSVEAVAASASPRTGTKAKKKNVNIGRTTSSGSSSSSAAGTAAPTTIATRTDVFAEHEQVQRGMGQYQKRYDTRSVAARGRAAAGKSCPAGNYILANTVSTLPVLDQEVEETSSPVEGPRPKRRGARTSSRNAGDKSKAKGATQAKKKKVVRSSSKSNKNFAGAPADDNTNGSYQVKTSTKTNIKAAHGTTSENYNKVKKNTNKSSKRGTGNHGKNKNHARENLSPSLVVDLTDETDDDVVDLISDDDIMGAQDSALHSQKSRKASSSGSVSPASDSSDS
ncbi:unnamed protein product, partial [Amoebophrya sp. A25]